MSESVMLRKAVFLDRDGVLNRIVMRGGVVSSPWSIGEFFILPEAVAFCDTLRNANWLLVVVTNQPDIERGNLSADELASMHAELQRVVCPAAIEVCMSGDDSDNRRKPNPGMLLDSAAALGIDLASSWILGDSRKDIGAGHAAGVRTLLLATDYNKAAQGAADFDAASHEEALAIILGQPVPRAKDSTT
ncbi:MAG: HAD-IIIA family hydrolase [Bacteroidota bacterium]